MKTLALRIYLAVVTVLLLFALVAGWLAQRNLEHERLRFQSQSSQAERTAAWGELIENSLPDAQADPALQAAALLDWSERLRLPMALDDPQGQRIATAPLMLERLNRWPELSQRLQSTQLSDGRTLWVLRSSPGWARPRPGVYGPLPQPGVRHDRPAPGPGMHGPPAPHGEPWLPWADWVMPGGLAGGASGLLLMLVILFVAVAAGAWPVANRLTRRLKLLRQGVERFGQGHLQHRVDVEGRDEVADLARSFNQAAQQIEELVTAHRSLLANASHELRSPLARMKMAVSMLADAPAERAAQLKEEIHQDVRELDALVEEVLLASRLDALPTLDRQSVDITGLLLEEARRVDAHVDTDPRIAQRTILADERLLRRAIRNLLENARRYGRPADGQASIESSVRFVGASMEIIIEDRGPGVPPDQRERIFEPFYRLPGHAEYAGGVGLGLSLVRQIAQRHGGDVRCEPREGGGSRFIIRLPASTGPDQALK